LPVHQNGNKKSCMIETQEVRPCQKPGHVVNLKGSVMAVPQGWDLLPPGNALLTRRVKAAGPHWVMKQWRKNRFESLGVWADSHTIAQIQQEVTQEQSDPTYEKRLESGRKRREKEQIAYEAEFEAQVLAYLNFHPRYEEIASKAAKAITRHAIPVGSGTVARTQRIPIEERAEAATIAWMRHQTTDYDVVTGSLAGGERRERRRTLAIESRLLLKSYRRGEEIDLQTCPLALALKRGGTIPDPIQ
jgi:hypothetical protein